MRNPTVEVKNMRFMLLLTACVGLLAPDASGQLRPAIPDLVRSGQGWPAAGRTWQTAFGDLDGDGDLDAVFANLDAPSAVLLNDGSGRFTASDQSFPRGLHGIEIGDLDGDGDEDLFFAPLRGSTHPVYLNDGTANFEARGPEVGRNELVRLLDVENDGDLDAYLLYSSDLLLNDGSGVFNRSERRLPGMAFFSDLNRDGLVDLVSGEWGKGIRVLLNDGAGAFREHSFLSMPTASVMNVAFEDMDGDGDTDVVYMDGTDDHENPSGILFNDGTGHLSDSGQRLPEGRYGHPCTGDLNGDGTPDVVFQGRDARAQVWLNAGIGRLVDSGIRLGDQDPGWNQCVVADLDGDGDRDIFLTDTRNDNHGLWFNQLKGGDSHSLPHDSEPEPSMSAGQGSST